ncbi:hypothetical protein KKG29_02390 [Patescibacteria group bacterium]|nr:hypothetical protein [Patescibacteria group bacterium]MBU4000006.1 hypothetical protein [Patescibacteria group bacterium]MBU4056716.1 hypothetical protein [Patescibacteria group bacterium]MBU4368658.1 hypothetical protein [Patescibacteria group bacterium]
MAGQAACPEQSRGELNAQKCSILELVRTHFAAAGGEKPPAKTERLRRKI